MNNRYFFFGERMLLIVGNYNITHVYLVIESGSRDDGYKNSGLNHLCEHVFLKIVEDKYLNHFRDSTFDYKGHTGYTTVIFEFKVSSIKKNINAFLRIVKSSMELQDINPKYIKLSKQEIIDEILFKKDIIETKKINSFLFDIENVHLPIGQIEDINNISNHLILTTINNYSKKNKLIIHNNVFFDLFNNEKLNNLKQKPMLNNDTINIRAKNILKNKNQLYIYIKMKDNNCIRNYIAENIFENIFINRLCKAINNINADCKTKISVIRKKIDNGYYFLLIKIENFNYFVIPNFNKCILDIYIDAINGKGFLKAKKSLLRNVSSIKYINDKLLLDNSVNYFLYKDMMLQNVSDFKLLANMIRGLSLADYQYESVNITLNNIKIVY